MKLLLVIPYRDRKSHLEEFIPYISETLLKQDIIYKIVVVEQNEGKLFNRGLLCNIGFKQYHADHDYVIFHDVDMICDTIDYSYCKNPCSLLRFRSKTQYKRMYDNYFGGITLFPNEHFININGFSNEYWGWGAEDDDLLHRCFAKKILVNKKDGVCKDLETVDADINRLKNPQYTNNLNKFRQFKFSNLQDQNTMIKSNGLSNVEKYYTLQNIIEHKNYTFLKVKL